MRGETSTTRERPSTIGDFDGRSETQTLDSTAFDYLTENQRTYHSFGDSLYWGPNDQEALDKLDFGNSLFLETLDGKLHLAPVTTNIAKTLDLGTGTGIWAIEFAD